MTDEPQYHDLDGNPCSLDTLCIREPAWAANRIRVMRPQVAALERERDELRAKYNEVRHERDHFERCHDEDCATIAQQKALLERCEDAVRFAADAAATTWFEEKGSRYAKLLADLRAARAGEGSK